MRLNQRMRAFRSAVSHGQVLRGASQQRAQNAPCRAACTQQQNPHAGQIKALRLGQVANQDRCRLYCRQR